LASIHSQHAYTSLLDESQPSAFSNIKINPLASEFAGCRQIEKRLDKRCKVNCKMKIVHLALAAFLPVALASSAPTSPARHLRLPVVNQTSAINAPAPEYTFDELFQLQKKFLDEFIYPENGVQVRSILYLTPPSSHRYCARKQRD